MRLRSLLLFVVIACLTASSLPAQMGGGRMPGMGTRGMVPSGGMLASDMMELPVAPDGAVFVVKKSATGSTYDLAAINSDGTPRWTYPLDSRGMSFAAIAGDDLVLSSMQTTVNGTSVTFTSQLLGLSLASGVKHWSLDLNGGIPMGITPFKDGFYVLVMNALPSTARSLISVGTDGRPRWTVKLD